MRFNSPHSSRAVLSTSPPSIIQTVSFVQEAKAVPAGTTPRIVYSAGSTIAETNTGQGDNMPEAIKDGRLSREALVRAAKNICNSRDMPSIGNSAVIVKDIAANSQPMVEIRPDFMFILP